MVTRRTLIAAAVPGLLLALTTVAGTAGATEIYRWVDAQGNVHFGDSPPSDRQAEQIEIRPPIDDASTVDDTESAPGEPMAPEPEIAPGEEATGD